MHIWSVFVGQANFIVSNTTQTKSNASKRAKQFQESVDDCL